MMRRLVAASQRFARGRSAPQRSALLCVAALLSFLVAALHVGIIAAGASAYRYFGAGESMARLAEQGSALPAVVTAGATALFVLAGRGRPSACGRRWSGAPRA